MIAATSGVQRDPAARGRRLRAEAARRSLDAVFFLVLMAFASITLWPIYRSPEFVRLVIVSLLVGAGLAVTGLMMRLASIWILVLVIVAFFVFGVWLAVPSETRFGVLPTLAGWRELVAGVALGWKQLLTISLPVGAYQALLVPALVLLLPSTVIGTSMTLRSRRPEWALVPVAVVFVAGIVFGPSTAVFPAVSGLGLLAGAIAWCVRWRLGRRRRALLQLLGRQGAADASSGAHERPLGRPATWRPVIGALVSLILAIAASGALTTLAAPTTARWVARSLLAQPFDPRDYVSPLSGFRAYEQSPRASSPQLSVTGLPRGGFVRIATLDDYDGVRFSVGAGSAASGTFDRVPTTVDQSHRAGGKAAVEISIHGYSGVWLPTVGQLEAIDVQGGDAAALRDDFFYNDATGTAAVLGGVRAGDSYRLLSLLPTQPAPDELGSLRPGSSRVPAPRGVPGSLTSTLSRYIRGVSGQGARLQAALNGLRREGYVSHGVAAADAVSRSGHGADRLAQLFTEQPMIGDAEQYAAAAALMANQLGFPARVVLGFQAPSTARAASGVLTFSGSDITALIEVDTAQFGWVLLDPNPEPRPIPDHDQHTPDPVSRPQSVIQPPPPQVPPRDDRQPPPATQTTPTDTPAWLVIVLAAARVAGWLLLGAALVLAPFGSILTVKAQRRARRRRLADPRARMTAGWSEFRDSALDHGVAVSPMATRSEWAAAVGGETSLRLARMVDHSVFAPGDVAPAEAERVWSIVAELRRRLSEGLTRRQRIRAAISLRSLHRYHGGKEAKR